jgi:hypothetical protein
MPLSIRKIALSLFSACALAANCAADPAPYLREEWRVQSPEPAGPWSPRIRLTVDGGIVFVESDAQAQKFLRHVGADGRVQWRQPIDTELGPVDVSSSQACVYGGAPYGDRPPANARIECFRLSDGERVLAARLDGRAIRAVHATATAGRVFVCAVDEAAPGSGCPVYLLQDTAPPRRLEGDHRNPWMHLTPDDRLMVLERGVGMPPRLDRFDRDGQNLSSITLPPSIHALDGAQVDTRGQLWIRYQAIDDPQLRLARIDDQGRFADPVQPPSLGWQVTRIDADAHGAVVQSYLPILGDFEVVQSILQRLSPRGDPRWTYRAPAEMPEIIALHVGESRIQALEYGTYPTLQWQLSEIDPLTGDVRARRPLLMPPTGWSPRELRMLGPERIRYVRRQADQLVAGTLGLAEPVVIADAAAAMRGAWAMPGLSGQGFAFDYSAGPGVLSAAWYSHDQQATIPPDSPATLQWHILAGTLPAGDAGVLEMDLHENRGGAFDAPPVTSARRIGAASLRMFDCDSATLSYTFDDHRVAPRTVALMRASPRTQACALRQPHASGAVIAAPAYTPNSDLGGTWYEPSTSGQGMNIVVYSPADGTATETLGLGWFTYDPADHADEPTQQHWFTASGSFDDASQQRATLTIYRTTGGDRDTTATRNTHRVGEATLERIDCDSATLSYRFDDTPAAAAFAAKSRTIPLQRLGACPN